MASWRGITRTRQLRTSSSCSVASWHSVRVRRRPSSCTFRLCPPGSDNSSGRPDWLIYCSVCTGPYASSSSFAGGKHSHCSSPEDVVHEI
eukprot:scaffold7167_cov165-Amphora_coffeaeformis.AAC.2